MTLVAKLKQKTELTLGCNGRKENCWHKMWNI